MATQKLHTNQYIYDSTKVSAFTLYCEWTSNNDEIVNKNGIPKVDIYAYLPEENKFLQHSYMTRIFDNFVVMTGSTGYIVRASDDIPLGKLESLDFWEYMIKPSYLYRDKLEKIVNKPNSITVMSGESSTWFDTLNTNPTDNTEYGFYNPETDYYFVVVRSPIVPRLEALGFTYPEGGNCKLYQQKSIVEYCGSGGTYYQNYSSPANQNCLVYGSAYTVVLDYRNIGSTQVAVNGITLTPTTKSDTDFDNGDYYATENTVTFARYTLESGDTVNMTYAPFTDGKNYHIQNIVVPNNVTSATTDSIFHNGYHYFINLDYLAYGDVGVVFNGTVLTNTGDYSLVGQSTIQLNGVTYPDGLTTGDTFSVFYMTYFTLEGIATKKVPNVDVKVDNYNRVDKEYILYVYDVSGQTVSTQIEKLPKNTKGGPISLPAIVPGPGLYTYKVVSNAYYPLINNKTIVTSNSTNTISFRMNASTFYNVNYPNNRGNIGRIGAGY
tara:strand:+ start:970 stop:2451 length:1482 start_codon:yes stop_codon:yes gene_type:complete